MIVAGLAAMPLLAVAALFAGYLRVREPTPPSEIEGVDADPLSNELAERAGVSLAVHVEDPGIERTGARWYFNWRYRPHDGVDLEFVPLVCGYPGNDPVSDEHLDDVRTTIAGNPTDYPDGTLFLVGNEIGYRPQHDGRSPDQYARDFHRCTTMLKSLNPTFQVSVGPAILTRDPRITKDQVGAANGVDYLAKVIAAYRDQFGEIPADYFAATGHVLEAGPDGMADFRDGVTRLRQTIADAGLQNRKVILTEFGIPVRGPQPADIAAFMRDSINYVATATDSDIGCTTDRYRLVQRWAWFTARPLPLVQKIQTTGFGALVLQLAQTSLFSLDGEPTYLSRVYASMTSGTHPPQLSR